MLQETPTPRYSGIVSSARKKRSEKVALYVKLPSQESELDDVLVVLTVMAGGEQLCAVIVQRNRTLAWGQDLCKIGLLKTHEHWCFTVEPTNQWRHPIDYHHVAIDKTQPPSKRIGTIKFYQLREGTSCMIQKQHVTVTQSMQNRPEEVLTSVTSRPDSTLVTIKVEKSSVANEIEETSISNKQDITLISIKLEEVSPTTKLEQTSAANKLDGTTVTSKQKEILSTIWGKIKVTNEPVDALTTKGSVNNVTVTSGNEDVMTKGTEATLWSEINRTTTMQDEVIMTPTTKPGEDNVTTKVNKILTIDSDVPIITNQSILSEVMDRIRSSNFYTTRTLKQIEPDPDKKQIVVKSGDRLYKQAKANNWYKWVAYTGKQIQAEDCYMCAKSRQDALYVTNTKHSWGLCGDEIRQRQLQKQKQEGGPTPTTVSPILTTTMNFESYSWSAPTCSAQCLIYVGSSEYSKYLDMNNDDDFMPAFIKPCREVYKRLSNEIGELSVPKGVELYVERELECYQNNEESTKAKDVGMIQEDLCAVIWDITKDCSDAHNMMYTWRPPPAIKSTPANEHLMWYMLSALNNCMFQNQDEVVADQFWLCGNEILRSTLPKPWKGRCARVQAVTEVVLIPPLKDDDTSLGGNNIGRQKRAYTPDPEIKIDKIGQPRGIPSEYKARNEVAAGFEAIFPIIGLVKNAEWINYIYYNQQRFINYTDDALSALGKQLRATSQMTWQNRQALDWLLAEKGGVCALIGDMCCTFIPNNTAPEGSFTLAMNKLKRLRQEVKNNAGHGNDWMTWLELSMGKWGAILAKVGVIVLIVFTLMGLIFCCCIPVLRSMIASRLDKQMVVALRGTVETTRVEWEYVGDQNGCDDKAKEAELKAMLKAML